MSKRLSKCIACFDYFDNFLIVLSATIGSICNSYWNTCRNSKCKSYPCIFIVCRTCIKLLKTTKNNKKKHNKIVMLARTKLNSIESKISESLMNNQVSHGNFMIIINEERNYRELRESIRMMKGQEDEKIDID